VESGADAVASEAELEAAPPEQAASAMAAAMVAAGRARGL